MTGSRERKRQQKLEKSRKKREAARRESRQRNATLPTSPAALLRAAADAPFGPAWISEAIDSGSETELITVIVTRRVRSGILLPELALVDRTCLGVKDAVLAQPAQEYELVHYVANLEGYGPLRPCDPLLAQSVVLHAIEYAAALGFAPHPDFELSLFLPRPEQLLDTPGARRPQPYYVAGPHDLVERIFAQLDRVVGRGNYEFVAPEHLLPPGFLDDHDHDHDDLPDSVAGAIDWTLAIRDAPSDDILEELDLREDADLQEAVESLTHAIESGYYLDWEAVIREEQDLPLSKFHARALDSLLSFADEEDDDWPILYIDEIARPIEPWYETVRRVASHLLREQAFEGDSSLGEELLEAIARHATHLSLPPGCIRPEDVVPAELRERLLGAEEPIEAMVVRRSREERKLGKNR